MTRKAAVVIGVDKTGNLATLESASKGAKAVAKWLEGEGYDLKLLTDCDGPVKAHKVEEAITKFVTLPPRYELLVVYFSGHGYWHARSDLWLLSGAPVSGSEAINLEGAMYIARYSGIPNVVFISDACRSIPDSSSGAKVKGIDAFPNYTEITEVSKIDYFKATSEARAAYEGEIDGQPKSVLTHALMSAYKTPLPEMISEKTNSDEIIRFVPNRKLEEYLKAKVNEILSDIRPDLTQTLEVNVPSNEETYIAKVHDESTIITERPDAGDSNGGGDSGAEATRLVRSGIRSFKKSTDSFNTRLSYDAVEKLGFIVKNDTNNILKTMQPTTDPEEISFEAHMPSMAVDELLPETGFLIKGAIVEQVIVTGSSQTAIAEVINKGNGSDAPAVIDVKKVSPACSVVILLQDGRCFVLAALEKYLGHAVVNATGLSNVNYIPSVKHQIRDIYEHQKAKVDTLRAMVAIQVRNNTFKIPSEKEADDLGNITRMMKMVDPTLGLYAVHAFAHSANIKNILSVRKYMQRDLEADLYDVVVLSPRGASVNELEKLPVVPFCPMLTQTWNMLRPSNISVPESLNKATPYLCNSLWTTFQPKGAEFIMKAVGKGDLK